MSKKDLFKLTTDARGNFKRTIGVKLVDGKYIPATFYLGRDYDIACDNVRRLERCWNAVTGASKSSEGVKARWDATTYDIAKAVAAGKTRVDVVHPLSSDFDLRHWGAAADMEVARWLADLQGRFPFIVVALADERLQDKVDFGLGDVEKRAAKVVEDVRGLRGMTTGATVADAIEGYRRHVQKKYRTTDGTLTGFCGVVCRRLDSLLNQLDDKKVVHLSKLNMTFIDEWLMGWANRPTSKRNKPVSVDFAKGVISTIRDFVRWLHRSSDFDWRKPADYEVLPIRVRPDHNDDEEKVKTYKRDHLRTLWEYATPRERVYIALGLNCGFGMGEVATLRTTMVDLDKRIIKGRRSKTGVYCRWRLWPETVAALRWYLDKVRPQSDSPFVFVKESGLALNSTTEGGHRKQDIPNAWVRLRTRIVKDHPLFPKLSYNKLRKTGANWFRSKMGGELADVYLAHGKRQMVDHYSNKPFRRMFGGLKRLRAALNAVFEVVADPFPDVVSKGNRSLSLNTVRKIQQMRAAGFKLKKVAEECGVGIDTVRRYQTKRDSRVERADG